MPANHRQFVFPDDVRWDDARHAWNLAADLRPAVVALPSSIAFGVVMMTGSPVSASQIRTA